MVKYYSNSIPVIFKDRMKTIVQKSLDSSQISGFNDTDNLGAKNVNQ